MRFHYSRIFRNLHNYLLDVGQSGGSLCHHLMPHCSKPATAALVLIASYSLARSPCLIIELLGLFILTAMFKIN